MNKSPKNVLNRIYSAEIVAREFKHPDTGDVVKFSVLELGLRINGETVKLPFNLPKKSNAELLILASSQQKENWLESMKEENAM